MEFISGLGLGLVIAGVVDLLAYSEITRLCIKYGVEPHDVPKMVWRRVFG